MEGLRSESLTRVTNNLSKFKNKVSISNTRMYPNRSMRKETNYGEGM